MKVGALTPEAPYRYERSDDERELMRQRELSALLVRAVRAGDVWAAVHAINRGAVITPAFPPLLNVAAERNDVHMMRVLLDAGADVNVHDAIGWTAMHVAASNGRADIIGLLAHKRAAVNARDRGGQTPLIFAVRRGHADAVAMLLRCGADANVSGVDGALPLVEALYNGAEVIAGMLVAYGADTSAATRQGTTPLIAAVIGSPHLVPFLTMHGAALDAQDDDGMTALMYAARRGNLAVVKELVLCGADDTLADNSHKGKTALDYAEAAGHLRVVDYLSM